MSKETDTQLKRIVLLLVFGLLVLSVAIYPFAKKAYDFMLTGEVGQLLKDIKGVKQALVMTYGHENVLIIPKEEGSLYVIFVDSRFTMLPESVRDDKAKRILNTVLSVYSTPEQLREFRVDFMKKDRSFSRASKKQVFTYVFEKDQEGKWQRVPLENA